MLLKRIFDLLVSTFALIALVPVLLAVALLVKRRLGSPVLFRQVRPGLHGQPFTILKFRTMSEDRDQYGQLLPAGERLTPFGRALRRTSLDELPELLNVVRGDMSLVGPRPLKMEYLARYSELQARRHNVRPGLTGLAQVRGRNELSWEDRFLLDVQYVETRTMLLDIRIIIATVLQVLNGRGVESPHGGLMPPFSGD